MNYIIIGIAIYALLKFILEFLKYIIINNIDKQESKIMKFINILYYIIFILLIPTYVILFFIGLLISIFYIIIKTFQYVLFNNHNTNNKE